MSEFVVEFDPGKKTLAIVDLELQSSMPAVTFSLVSPPGDEIAPHCLGSQALPSGVDNFDWIHDYTHYLERVTAVCYQLVIVSSNVERQLINDSNLLADRVIEELEFFQDIDFLVLGLDD